MIRHSSVMLFHRIIGSVSNEIDIIVLVAVTFLLQVSQSEEIQSCRDSDNLWSDTRSCDMRRGRVALVLGASGETGAEVVKSLVEREEFTRLVLVTRRQLQFPDESKYNEKIIQKIVDFDNLPSLHSEVFRGVDTAFCCLGTTRAAGVCQGGP